MISIELIKQKVFTNLESEFLEFGFKFSKSKDRYEKISNGCRLIYSFIFHKRSDEIAIEIFVLIEHIKTAKIYKKATGHSLSNTIGNEIGKIFRNPNGKMKDHTSENLTIQNEKDISQLEKDILQYFKKVAIPYYKSNGSLEKIDEILNANTNEITVHANTQYFRCPNGLIVARLINRINYNELVSTYDMKMEDVSDLFKNRYESVKKYLTELV
jgi:hypothetical protein